MGLETLLMAKVVPASENISELLMRLKKDYYDIFDSESREPIEEVIADYRRLCREDPRFLAGDGGEALIRHLANKARAFMSFELKPDEKIVVIYIYGPGKKLDDVRDELTKKGFADVRLLGEASVNTLVREMAHYTGSAAGYKSPDANVFSDTSVGFEEYARIVMSSSLDKLLTAYSRVQR